MYTTTRMNTKECNNVEIRVSNHMVDGEIGVDLAIISCVANPIGHMVSELTLSLTPEQWLDVVYKIKEALKENGYANEIRV